MPSFLVRPNCQEVSSPRIMPMASRPILFSSTGRYNGQPTGHGWTSPADNGAFGTDYIHRAGAVKADPFDNKRNETMYFYTDNDSQSQQLVGKSSYAVTLPKGQLPPVKGFWSLTM